MHPAFRSCAVVFLAISSLAAQSAPASGTTSRPKKTVKHIAAKKAPPAVTVEDLQQLRDAMAAQQQQLDQMLQQMQQRDQQLQQTQQQLADAQAAAQQAQSKASAVETANTEQKASCTQLQGDVTDMKNAFTSTAATTQDDQRKVNELSGALSRLRWTGDVRVRFEDFFQDGTTNRYRPRVRLRLGVEGKLTEDLTGGIAVASGALNDPTSSNSTLGDEFQRKPISLDRGYVTYNPSAYKWLSLTAGKFAYTWIRTNQTFDPDINPEGFSEKLSFDVKSLPLVKNVTFTGLQLYMNEANNTANSVTPLPAGFPTFSNDSWVYGGQISAKLQPISRWTMTPSYSVLNFRNPDVLVNGFVSLVSGGFGITGSRVAGVVNTTGFAPNGMSNALCAQPVGTTNLPRFCSDFIYSDLIVNNVIKTPLAKFPLTILGEYEVNLGAASNNSHLYQAEVSLGQTKNKHDFQFGYAFTRSEQDAVISSFAESDQRFPTNVLEHKVYYTYKIAPNTTLGYTQWIGRALDTTLPNTSAFGFAGGKPFGFAPATVPGGHEPWLKRGQLDLIYTF